MLKFTLKLYQECCYMFRLYNHHHQGAYCLCFAKVIIVKIVSQNTSLWNHFGRVAA